MSWRDWLVSRHTRWLEAEVADLKRRNEQEVATLRSSFQSQLDSVITHNKQLQDELQRTRILLSPGLQAVSLPHEHESESPPVVSEIPTGTPWQRVRAREMKAEEERWRKQEAERAEAERAKAKETSNGGNSEGRVGPS